MIEATRKEAIVRQRYAAGAKERSEKLCCPVDYDAEYLKVIPQEVIERDYGCGDPSRYLHEGETVLDLGSGTGKICFIAAQIVGPKLLDRQLKESPITNAPSFLAADELAEELRVKHPLIASDSIDVVVSNCVLNLVEPKSKRQLFDEIFRVLKKGGRAVICDIVSDEPASEEMQNDPELWSGCISGALTEEGFLQAFEHAGFYGIQILKRDAQPWRTVQGIEFRSVTSEAFKGKQGECFERNQAVIYRGPFKEVLDDDNHRVERGKRYAVCDKTYNLYKKAPYREFFEFVDPIVDVSLAEANPFDYSRTSLRHPKETKGEDYDVTIKANNKCCDGGRCS